MSTDMMTRARSQWAQRPYERAQSLWYRRAQVIGTPVLLIAGIAALAVAVLVIVLLIVVRLVL